MTPAPAGSRQGNRVSALRYARILRELGARVRVLSAWDGGPADLLIVLNAFRGARALLRARREHPELAIVAVVTGTDVYRHLESSPGMRRALAAADAIVGLQSDSVRVLPLALRRKARVILQSYDGAVLRRRPSARFEFLVLGHLRPEKDPFRAALAARRLPARSEAQVVQAGKALSPAMRRRALREMQRNPRYRWLGELARPRALERLASARALVLTSRIEGGPSVFSEALAFGVPILASRIGASLSILTPRHPGLFDVGDTAGLAVLMLRFETDLRFRRRLEAWSRKLAPRVRPEKELEAWRALLDDVKRSPRRATRRGRRAR